MRDTGAVSVPQPAPHPFRTTCLRSPHYTYAIFLTSIIEGREHKELVPEENMSQIEYIHNGGHRSDTSHTFPNAGNVNVVGRGTGSSVQFSCCFLLVTMNYLIIY